MRTVAFVGALLFSGIAPAAQTPAPAPAPAASQAVNPTPPLEPRGYDYDAAGRRDPFVSLVRRTTGASGTSATQRPKGLGGLLCDEITMRGVAQGKDGWVALVRGVDSRTYWARPGDKLYDGEVKSIAADGMVVLQKVSDPLSTISTREVRKPLRPAREAQ